ncbi:GLPGLI family protein [Dokdonia sinensis]|uniref:GLPGLI family protein n=1 Tax=Dokdonia sinensis TaxID=2479847 RepID=A0A3M0G377_9FLAO|nr:GLPGLI family protein [Dokdonia sinensis]RMB56662.1 GLPGLI family protein [Dokdonia sinensis]
MMKNIVLIVLMFAFAKAYSQKIEGIATYQTQRSVDIKMDSTSGMTSEMQKSIQEQLRKQFQKEFDLTFNAKEKVWKENESISTPQAPASGIQIMMTGNSDELYQNIHDQKYVQQSDMMGKLFLIEDTLEKPEWKLEKETKNIGQYTCFKATLTEEITESTLTSGDAQAEEVKKERVTTAWYTLDIPVRHGPDRFWGLPGLILEVNDGKMAMMCTKVVLNPSEEITIEAPTKGKKVTQDAYDEISEKKAQEMMERYQSKSSKKGETSSFTIKVGG